MPYQIVLTINDQEITTESVKMVVNYLNEALNRMQVSSYSVDCFRDGMKVMMGLEHTQEETPESSESNKE